MYNHRLWACCGMLLGVVGVGSLAWAQAPANRGADRSQAQTVIGDAAEDGKFVFVVFYRDDNAAVRAMADVVKTGVQKRDDKAAIAYVQVTNPAEQALVERYEVSRAPMPLTLAIAPNGAVTGVFSKTITDDKLDEAIVTPTMTRCMKSLQENQLVFVCVQTAEKAVVPNAVKEMQADPLFKNRITLVSMQLRDPAEGRLLNQMQINPENTTGVTAVLLAPPGVLIGKFDNRATGAQVAAALHKAGKCCDDANCKHGQPPARQTNQPAPSRRK